MSKPLRATNHCRHYSYRNTGLSGFRSGDHGGPQCALGIDLTAPAASKPCMPVGTFPALPDDIQCASRQNYTDAEREAWKAYVDGRLVKMAEAVAAIPAPIPCGSTGECKCPHCPGELRWSRASNGHVWLSCTTPDCVGPVHLNIDRKTSWPVSAGAKS